MSDRILLGVRQTIKGASKHGATVYRALLCAAVVLIARITGGDTVKIAPFAVLLVLFICGGLVLFPHVRYVTLPFLLLTLLLIFCYDSYDVFIGYLWLAPVVGAALLLHLVRLRPKLLCGPTLLPLAAVALATTLGGLGSISASEYFRPSALVFVGGLGVGLLFSYVVLKNEIKTEEDVRSFLTDMVWWGVTAAAVVFVFCIPLLPVKGIAGLFRTFQWSNNVSTMLMLAIPAPLALKRRGLFSYVFVFFMFFAVALVGSRGGQLLVGAELILCTFWAWRKEQEPIARLWRRMFFLDAVLCVVALLTFLFINREFFSFTVDVNEARARLLRRSVEDFLANPLFGRGIGFLGNADIYAGKTGTILWYHVFVAQVIGSLGLFGVLAWSWQLYTRFRLSVSLWKKPVFGAAVCYLGLFLMSQVNPGEFCPVPYAFLGVALFVLLEREAGEAGNALFLKRKHR